MAITKYIFVLCYVLANFGFQPDSPGKETQLKKLQGICEAFY